MKGKPHLCPEFTPGPHPSEGNESSLHEAQALRPAARGAQAFLKRLKKAVLELAEWLEVYWERTLVEHWPRIRLLLPTNVQAPANTLELARRLQVAPGGVNHHPSRWREAGLVESDRQGRSV